MNRDDTSIGGQFANFPATTFTMLVNSKDEKESKNFLEKLAQRYWKPVYIYIRKNWNKSNEDAKDLTQEFFAYLIEKKLHTTFKSSFRSYLKTSLKHFLIDKSRKNNAIKRGGEYKFVNIEFDNVQQYESITAEKAFDEVWKSCILDQAVHECERKLTSEGKVIYFKVFNMREITPNLDQIPTYEEIAKELNITEDDVRNHLRYARKLFKTVVQLIVQDYTSSNSEMDIELLELFDEQ